MIRRVNSVKTTATKYIDSTSTDNSSLESSVRRDFPDLFSGLGQVKTEYTIKLKENAQPTCIYTPRKIAHPLLPKVQAELENMIKLGVISPVSEPTDWCSGIVVVPKPNQGVRICVDLTQLNKSVQREIYPMSSVDESLAKLGQSKIFTKLDCKSGFGQIPLSPKSRRLTTFITPFGRFCFNRLPFGISSASEFFQRMMTEVLIDIEGVICHMDDILVHAKDQPTHDKIVREVLQRLSEAGLTLNEKCEFSKNSAKYLGHIIDENGIHPDPSKVEAIKKFPAPSSVTELQRFMGMVNQLAKYIPQLADINTPLRQLLRKDNSWIWDKPQETAFQQIKDLLTSPPVLAHYDPQKTTIVAADASNNGIGAVLSQIQEDGTRKPVYYISRSLTDTEQKYAVIEKEALATTWACERFNDYILGLQFTVETDHKPLVPFLTTTELYKMPPRIQRFRLRLMRYSPEVVYVQGKSQITADALSRAPVNSINSADLDLINEATKFAKQSIDIIPASTNKLQEIREEQKADDITLQVREYCIKGWPKYMPENPLLKQYWTNRDHFTIVDDLLLFDDRLVIPRSMRLNILNRIHEGHLGITKCCAFARSTVWWPYITSDIEDMIKRCHTCAIHQPEHKEPLLPLPLPDRPWARLGMDLLELFGKKLPTHC